MSDAAETHGPEIARLEGLLKLREPFPPEVIGKLPKITCPACSKAPSRNCDRHDKARCSECGNWITTQHVHLDYVGHAAITDRLRQVDPGWGWEPFAVGVDGLPAVKDGNLWIRLTVCGVTRVGVGDGKNPKEMIGDAIRNAAMRFGAGLDLWAKEDLSSMRTDATAEAGPDDQTNPAARPAPQEPPATASQQTRIAELLAELDDDGRASVAEWWKEHLRHKVHELTEEEADGVVAHLATILASDPPVAGEEPF